MNAQLEQSYHYCRKLTQRASSTFYVSSRLFKPAVRRDLLAVYAFCRIADDIADAPGLDTDRRRAELSLLGHTLKTGRYEADDLLWPALFDVIKRRQIPFKYFYELLEGVGSDITPNTPKNLAELEHYSYLVAGVVGVICVYIFEVPTKAAKSGAKHLGIAMQITNIMRDVSADKTIGRLYLPLALLKKHKLKPSDIQSQVYDQRFRVMMKELADISEAHYSEGKKAVGLLSPELRKPVYSMLSLYRAILRRIEQKQFNVYNKRVRLNAIQKLGLVLGTYLSTDQKLIHKEIT